jgi:sugar phosphate permease
MAAALARRPADKPGADPRMIVVHGARPAYFILDWVGLALIMPALTAFYIDITAEQHRSRIHGIKSSAASLGGVLGPLLLMGATTLMAPRGVFISAGVLLVVTAVLALVVLREPSRAGPDARGQEWEWASGRATITQATLRGIVARARTARQRSA